ncbi:aldo/keto reductase [Streptomyces sp. NRRL S-350]|uniref:aldo/keto reductase n=1 Tax=Streptomyces sp. NRRL S-350 TaxID=1463902 RepID=UPI000AA86B05|nr:aldo/keto reductase [Streptomyces sp. NRRL S-350]
MDTAFNYLSFASHRTLFEVAGDLLPQFTISTKIGFFPHHDRPQHSLDPQQLWAAAEKTAEDLGRIPDVLLLHNPEHSLAHQPPAEAKGNLLSAFETMAEITKRGLCTFWGISSWRPRPLLTLTDAGSLPPTDVLMTRAGLLVDADTLAAGELLAVGLGVEPDGRWGMSPFGGDSRQQVWTTFNTAVFLEPGQKATNIQSAFRVAFEIPPVHRVAVGTGSIEHLRSLVDALSLRVDRTTVDRYRSLLNERSSTPS